MKKGIAISLVSFLMIGMLHIWVANHYCSGNLVATRVSVSGQTAGCGMESAVTEIPVTGFALTHHCCENVLLCLATDNNYIPSFSFTPEIHQYKIQTSDIAFLQYDLPFNISRSSTANIFPPGMRPSVPGKCSGICVLRI
jgi:hypothetical protein